MPTGTGKSTSVTIPSCVSGEQQLREWGVAVPAGQVAVKQAIALRMAGGLFLAKDFMGFDDQGRADGLERQPMVLAAGE